MGDPVTDILVSAAKSFSKKALEGPIQTLNDVWNGAFGYRVAYWAKGREALAKKNYQEYISSIDNKVVKIPEERLQDPKLSVVGPAIEASKYYTEEKEIREMFANLITSSMDSTYNGIVQHSFVEIIKQLSPYDAKLFASLEEEFFIFTPSHQDILGRPYPKNFSIYYYQNEKFPNRNLNAISLENLKKQGLIDFQSIPKISEDNSRNTWQSLMDDNKYKTKIERYGYITKLGKAFKKVCLKDSL